MKCLRLVFCLLMVVLVVSNSQPAYGLSRKELDSRVKAAAVLLMDGRSGEILYARRPTTPYPPASTVKLLTALVVWEATGLRGQVKVDVSDTRVEPSHVPLRPGETVSVRDLTTALLVGSANDTAMALGRHVAGSHEAFMRLLNQRARELGCENSVFKNPNGLPAPGQVTTCRDMMIIFQHVLAIKELREICALPYFTLTTQAGTRRIRNHNKLLGVYPGMGPAKTGWTIASRHTYAAAAQRGDRQLLLVLLKSPNKWTDSRALFDYGFSLRRPDPSPEIAHASTAASPAPSSASSPTPPVSASTTRYTVRPGDTLSSISRRYGVSVARLVEHNRISDPHQLQPGMQIEIP